MKQEIDFNAMKHPAVGACGLSCRLCPNFNRETKSRCPGCKTEYRFLGPCPMLHCALKKKGVEFCWDCPEGETCEKWTKHREFSENNDTFICYQKLNSNIAFIKTHGVEAFEKTQKDREQLLKQLLGEFNEGRSKSYYCIAATVLEIKELEESLDKAREASQELDIKGKAKLMHSIIDSVAKSKGYYLIIRK